MIWTCCPAFRDRSRNDVTESVSAAAASSRRAVEGIVVIACALLVDCPAVGRVGPICFPAVDVFGFAATVPSLGGVTSDCESDALGCGLWTVVSLPGCAGLHAVRVIAPRHAIRVVCVVRSMVRVMIGVIGLGARATALTART